MGLVVHSDVLRGTVSFGRSFMRLLAPAVDLAALLANLPGGDIPDDARMQGERSSIRRRYSPIPNGETAGSRS